MGLCCIHLLCAVAGSLAVVEVFYKLRKKRGEATKFFPTTLNNLAGLGFKVLGFKVLGL